MGTDYKQRLRERSIPDLPPGRPPSPSPAVRLRAYWTILDGAERADFCAAAGLAAQAPGTPDTPVADCPLVGPSLDRRPVWDVHEPAAEARKMWLRLKQYERAEFLSWAGLVPAPTDEQPHHAP